MLAIIVLCALITGIGKLAVALLGGADRSDVRDPMFAEEAETATMPPELYGDEDAVREDRSSEWVMPESAPVDKTAEQLGEEAR